MSKGKVKVTTKDGTEGTVTSMMSGYIVVAGADGGCIRVYEDGHTEPAQPGECEQNES